MQHNGNHTADKYFYLHDRLGSVRQIIDSDSGVVKYYTYKPFGELIESGGSFDNPFLFTGQWFDPEISQYYLRARQYDPILMRFTSRDPIRGRFTEPKSLHVYLYCNNDPINRTDPSGNLWGAVRWARGLANSMSAYYITADLLLGMETEPSDILDLTVGINAARETWFNKRYGDKDEPLFDRLFYLFAPKDTLERRPWECDEVEGFYRHCVAACRVNKVTKSPALTLMFALTAGHDWAWEINETDPIELNNHYYDIMADFAGITSSYFTQGPFADCRNSCEYFSKYTASKVCEKKK